MAKQRTIVVDLDHYTRGPVSHYGNPSFWLHGTEAGSGRMIRIRTATNSSVAYGIENWWSRGVDRRNVTLVIEGQADKGMGRVVDAYRLTHDANGERRYRA